MKSAASTQEGKKDAKQERVSNLVLAAPYSPEESSFQAERLETKKSTAAETRSILHCARKARKKANVHKKECDQNSLDDESSEYKKEAEPGAYSIARTQRDDHPIEEPPATIDGSYIVDDDDDVKERAMVVEADLVPELTSAEEVNIQEEEAVIEKKVQYRRALRVTMAWDGLAIICNIIGFVFLFLVQRQSYWKFLRPIWCGLLPSACCFFIATLIILQETMGCCASSLTLEQYSPDDKELLRETYIVSVASLCLFFFVAIPIIVKSLELQWLGYTCMTWYFAGTVFTFSRIRLLRRSKETRQKKSKCFWIVFLAFFLGLSGASIWRCWKTSNELYASEACGYDCVQFQRDYPTCTVETPAAIGNGFCDGGVYGTVECGFDGGDCLKLGERCGADSECASEFCNSTTKVCGSNFVAEHYPDCRVSKPDWIGDGECDGGYYASEACGFDGGDCLKLDEPCLQDDECASGFCNAETKVCS